MAIKNCPFENEGKMSSTIHVDGATYGEEELIAGKFEASTDLARKVLPFCRAWLAGQEKFVLRTSGSTGAPKSVTFHRAAMKASAALTQQALQLREGMHALVCLDTDFVAGQMMLVRGLEVGMHVHVVAPSANPFATISAKTPIDFVALVPYQLETILQSSACAQLRDVACTIIGGAPLESATAQKLAAFPGRFYATYGMTETLTHIALRALNGPLVGEAFRTLPTIQVSTDERGCLVIRAPHLGDPVVTNDVARLINPNEFEWLGRLDLVINTGGIKIHPEMVERKLEPVFASQGVNNRFFIAAQPHPQLHQQVVLVVEGDATAVLTQVWPIARPLLTKYEAPKLLLSVPRFAETASGKIDRINTLRAHAQTYVLTGQP